MSAISCLVILEDYSWTVNSVIFYLLFTYLDYAGAVSNVANLEEQLAQVKDELRSSKEVIQEQTSTIQSLSGEGGSLKVAWHLYLTSPVSIT